MVKSLFRNNWKVLLFPVLLYVGLLLLPGCSSVAVPVAPVAVDQFETSGPPVVTRSLGSLGSVFDGLTMLPDISVSLEFKQPVPLGVVLLSLQQQGVNVVSRLDDVSQVKTEKDDEKKIDSDPKQEGSLSGFGGPSVVVPSYSGPLLPLLYSLRELTGYFFEYRQGILFVLPSRVFTFPLPVGFDSEHVTGLLAGFGVVDAVFSPVAGAVIFRADWLQLQSVRGWVQDHGGLSVVSFQVVLLESEITSQRESGFDWSQLGLSVSSGLSGSDNLTVAGADEGVFSVSGQAGPVSLSFVVRSLVASGYYHVLQSGRLSIVAGQKGTLDVSRKVPYVEEVTVSDGDDDNTMQGVTFSEVDAGIVLTLSPLVREGHVLTEVVATLQDVASYLEVGPVDLGLQRPVITARNFSTWAMLEPGKIALVGGLRYSRSDGSENRLSDGVGGFHSRSSREFEVVALIQPQLINYNFGG